ncbi:MAG TPA: hypothetical protein VFD84_18210 [Candidatus Binatia bacterium]|jgi:hypothetical protein|nr:hypothetical protein [Candidatus Binatia bacterium]
MSKLVAAIALAAMLAPAVALATDIEDFEKKVNKYAAQSGKDKGLCVCLNPAVFFYGASGYLRRTETDATGHRLVTVSCVIQGFDPGTGELDYQAGCVPFAPLAK